MYLHAYIANVDYLLISNDENVTGLLEDMDADDHNAWSDTPTFSLVYVEGRPGPLRCISVGGQPPPALTVHLLPPVSLPKSRDRKNIYKRFFVFIL